MTATRGEPVQLLADGYGRPRITCECGNAEFFLFGPFDDIDEPGLRRIYTCAKCGEQLRLYQTNDAYREAKALARAATLRLRRADADGR